MTCFHPTDTYLTQPRFKYIYIKHNIKVGMLMKSIYHIYNLDIIAHICMVDNLYLFDSK